VEAPQNLIRLFDVLRTIAEIGPVATADRDFTETSHDLLLRAMDALEATQGALFTFDSSGVRLTCVSAIGFDPAALTSPIQIGRMQAQRWMQTRTAILVKSDEVLEYFGTQQSKFLTALRCVMPLRVGSALVGALCLGARRSDARYGEMEAEAIGLVAGHLALVLQNQTLVLSLRAQIADNLRLLSSLDHSFDDALEAFATVIDAKDKHMRGHSMRVGRYAFGIGQALGLNETDVKSLRAAGQLHDVGRVTVDKSLSAKPSALLPEEFREIADHTLSGHQIVSAVRFPWREVPEVVRWHHERADGSGYPDNLRKDEIPLAARIVAVADSFDAMTSDRPYRRGHTPLDAVEELVRLAPLKFDADVVQGLLVKLRADVDGRSEDGLLAHGHLTARDLDRLAITLVNKTTNYRVYSA
jgi:HD-GYP domain-containing protein (c-di-GMP phosphodiesterase class II)